MIPAPPVAAYRHPVGCHKTFTVAMATRAIHSAYAGTRDVSSTDRRRLARFVRCQRNPAAGVYLHGVWARSIARWRVRRDPPMRSALASWYDDSGTTGCGFHATYGIATFVVACGGHVTLRGPAGMVVATRDDSGPYVAGRTFDLDPATKAALGCGDLCVVAYR